MADLSRRPRAEPDLEAMLSEVRPYVAYPPTPALAPAVRRRLLAQPERPNAAWRLWRSFEGAPPWRRSLALAGLVCAIAATVVGLSPAARTAVAERLGLKGIAIKHVPAVPQSAPQAGELGRRLQLGERVTLEEARRRAGFAVLTPGLPELGTPDEVYVGEPPPGGQVSFVYAPRPGLPASEGSAVGGVGLLLTQFRGSLQRDFMAKMLGPGTRLEQVTVSGSSGYWIEGRPHTFLYLDGSGNMRDETLRLAGNTLLWMRGGVTFRLEGARTREDALRIAASMR